LLHWEEVVFDFIVTTKLHHQPFLNTNFRRLFIVLLKPIIDQIMDSSNVNPFEYHDDDGIIDETTFNPLDLFCTSIDTLRGTEIDQTIPINSGWAIRSTPAMKVGGCGIATNTDHHYTTTGSTTAATVVRGNSPPPGRLASIMSNITTHTSNNSNDYDYEQEQILQTLCRRGIPPSLRRSAWIMNVVHASNPNMNKHDVADYGTFRKVRVIGK
jgi:hypothetical protein